MALFKSFQSGARLICEKRREGESKQRREGKGRREGDKQGEKEREQERGNHCFFLWMIPAAAAAAAAAVTASDPDER